MLNLDQYEMIKTHGFPKKGKFSQSYLLKSKDTGGYFVFKTVKKNTQNYAAIRAIQNEALFQFEHPNLPQKIELLENEHELILCKKFIAGNDLLATFDRLKKRNKLAFLQLFAQKISVLFNELDQLGVVHGDIRPENFIIHPTNNQDFEVHLIDFGLAFYPNKIDSRKLIFHLLYSAPEIILNELNLATNKSDMYSLGLVFYRLLAGEPPFQHNNPSILTNIVLTYPLEKVRKIPADIWQTIEKMCVKTSFRTAPNRMNHQDLVKQLQAAIEQRLTPSQLDKESQLWNTKYGWFNTSPNLF